LIRHADDVKSINVKFPNHFLIDSEAELKEFVFGLF